MITLMHSAMCVMASKGFSPLIQANLDFC